LGAIGPSIDHQAVWALVRRQHGVISRAQLLSFGFSPDAIRHRIARRRLVPEWPGVYRIGRRELDRDGRFMAAVLACGDGAVLSHESAAALWGIRKGGLKPIEVSIPANRRIRLAGIRPHRRNPMPPTTTIRTIILSQPLFTLVDLAARLETDLLEAAINEADKLNLVDPETLEAALEHIPRFPGLSKLRTTLARYSRTHSNLERRFLAIVRKARIPLPATQEHIGPGRIDFHWPELGLVVETDGLTYHRTPMQQLDDRRRDQAHTAAGRTQLRFANLQIRETPDEVVATLRATATRLGTLLRR
jgi:very-short-patch-repair endonuclease